MRYKIGAIALLFIIIITGCTSEKPEVVTSESVVEIIPSEYVDVVNTEGLYVILGVDTEASEIVLKQTDSGRLFLYSYNLATTFLDKFGGLKNITYFMPGKVIKLNRATRYGVIEEIQLSDEVWEYEDIHNYKVDAERGVFTIGVTNYQITPRTSVITGEGEGVLGNIGANDVLRVIGKDKEIYSISVTTGHGYLSFVNTGVFNNSLICIGDIYTMITGDMTMEVPEGIYLITAANKGYGGSVEVEVLREQNVTVDLDGIKGEGPKHCELKFRIALQGARIYLDGKLVSPDVVNSIPYGRHNLAVMAEGYEDWNKTLFVNSPTAEISLELSTEDRKDSSSNSNSNNNNNNSSNNSNNTNSNNNGNTNSNNNSNSNSNSSNNNNNNGNNNSSNNDNNNNSNNDKNNNSNDNTSSDSSKKDNDRELEYLTTISDMLSVLMGN